MYRLSTFCRLRIEPKRKKMYLMTGVPNDDSDQHAHCTVWSDSCCKLQETLGPSLSKERQQIQIELRGLAERYISEECKLLICFRWAHVFPKVHFLYFLSSNTWFRVSILHVLYDRDLCDPGYFEPTNLHFAQAQHKISAPECTRLWRAYSVNRSM